MVAQRNAENRQQNPLSHGLGRQSYAQKLYRMDEENPGKKHGWVDVWMKGRERPDGTIVKSAQEKYRQVKLAHERIMSKRSAEEGDEYFEDYDTDALTEVFGPEKRTRTRGVSSHRSKNQLKHAAIGKILLQQAGSSKSKTLIQSGSNNQSTCAQPSPMMNTSPPEVGSHSVQHTSQHSGQNLMNMFESMNHVSRSSMNPKVTLLDTKQNEVAEGYVVTDTTICHGRTIFPGEKKVWVEKVLIGDALIYDSPQDGMTVLHEIVDGGYLVWLEARLKY